MTTAAVIAGGGLLMMLSFEPPTPRRGGPKLALQKLNLSRSQSGKNKKTQQNGNLNTNVALPANIPTFGHPIIAGIGGTGFEESIRIDPTNSDRIYTSAPGSLSADTSWVWHSLDGGRTFKWVVGAAPLEGKVTTCHGGGDSEIAVDQVGRLYFNDLTLANFSTARSDDFGATFTCSNTGVPDTAVDRQWYAIEGDPLNGGSIYLANDEIGPGSPVCGSSAGNNVLVMYRSPVTGLEPTAGIEFGPANHVSAVGGCDEAIMGNNEISPIAATLGPATNATGDLAITGDTVLKYSYSTNQGNTWSTPITIDTSGSPDGVLHNNVFAWINAGDDGRVNIVWYGASAVANLGNTFDFVGCGRNVLNPPPQGKNINGPDAADGLWCVWMVQSTNAHAATPTFTAPVRASAHHVHRGGVMTVIGGQCGWASRALG